MKQILPPHDGIIAPSAGHHQQRGGVCNARNEQIDDRKGRRIHPVDVFDDDQPGALVRKDVADDCRLQCVQPVCGVPVKLRIRFLGVARNQGPHRLADGSELGAVLLAELCCLAPPVVDPLAEADAGLVPHLNHPGMKRLVFVILKALECTMRKALATVLDEVIDEARLSDPGLSGDENRQSCSGFGQFKAFRENFPFPRSSDIWQQTLAAFLEPE